MAQQPAPGKCVHCLKTFDVLTWDHVFPEAWYPDTTLPNLYKLQIPSCYKCNKEYGRLENDMMIRLALCVDPERPETAAIVSKGLRAINPDAGKSERDKAARAAKRSQILRQMIEGPAIPEMAIYPGFGEKWGRTIDHAVAITIPASSYRRLAEKLIRGIYYLERALFIEPPWRVQFFAVTDEGAREFVAITDKFGTEYAREPGVTIRLAVPEDEPMSSVAEISIWGRFKMYAAVISEP